MRKRSDQLLNYVIKPVIERCGYETVRADAISNPGLITPQVIDHLFKDELVVADLTYRNPNVFYELALRHASKMAVINIKDPSEGIPFDVSGLRTIDVDFRFIASMDECKRELERQVRSIEKDPDSVVTPVSFTLALLSTDQRENSQAKLNIELMSGLQSIKAELDEIKRRAGEQASVGEYLVGEAPEDVLIDRKRLEDIAKIFRRFEAGSARQGRGVRKK